MAKFRLDGKSSKLKQQIQDIEYDNGAHQPHFQHLLEVISFIEAKCVRHEEQQLILIGALSCVRDQIANSYVVRDPNNSRLHKAISELDLITRLDEAEDKDNATAMAKSAYQQYFLEAANNHFISGSQLAELKALAPVTEQMVNIMKRNLRQTDAANYDPTATKPQADAAATSSISSTISWLTSGFGLWANSTSQQTEEANTKSVTSQSRVSF